MRIIWVLSLFALFGCNGGLMTTGSRSSVVSPAGNATLSISGFVNSVQLNAGAVSQPPLGLFRRHRKPVHQERPPSVAT